MAPPESEALQNSLQGCKADAHTMCRYKCKDNSIVRVALIKIFCNKVVSPLSSSEQLQGIRW